ncbi:Aromatic ring-opening dioxygenase, catalytic subunit, LigB family [Paenibacillus sp. UNCCL117]|uniref:DODA-type extradiol aromatic ring-opening family dioxygenase n=1 Tax=unclassified Paenibacillus TaxID=185978 RepID=UPI00088C3DB0|nr:MULTISPECIES: class III extradiol ring-cleavage dioxygenase [unclassified Paenibacillus]SDE16061.1 Aromatic ring-opening dioxygenase, catalytic subunit, LigB family [Paenibacillus sp. cl123]SFW61062.1 Aromatic ring-opening dioxygenase, catalytic subunit, LigB family [Paenibacillus sp. UNCCL117]
MMPSLFLAHGSPMLALQQNDYTDFLQRLAGRLQPKAIVIFTAHWETQTTTVSASDAVYETIYDFGGFPDELYALTYPAKGSSRIAGDVKDRLEKQGIAVHTDLTRGLDHGSWTLLYRMYPAADIPVIQLSVNPYLPPAEQYKIGEALRGLGDEDILVIGSGVTVHNLRMVNWGQNTPEPWAVAFDDWLIDRLERRDLEALFSYDRLAPHAQAAVPRPEHFVPLFIALGAGSPDRKPELIHRSYELGTLSYACFEF